MLFNLISAKTLFLSLAIGLVGCMSPTYGQDVTQVEELDEEEYVTHKLRFVEFSIDRIIPIQTFKSSINTNLWSGNLRYLVQLSKEKLDFIGLEINYTQIANDSNVFSDSEVKTSSNFVGAFFTFRHFPNLYFWRIEPFAELAIGPQFFYTQTTTSFFDVDSTNDVAFDEVDTGVAYAAGVGFMLHITGQVFLTTQVNYFGGTSVTYLVKRDDQFAFPLDNFRPETSQTNYIKLQFGISVSI